jgi:hypothetical protein
MVVEAQNKLSYLNMICIRSMKIAGSKSVSDSARKDLRRSFPFSCMSEIV